MNTTAFRHYLNATGLPCKDEIWSLWIDMQALWPQMPAMTCESNNSRGTTVTLDTGGRILQLDLRDVEGHMYWTDRDSHETECCCEPTPLWREKFLDRIPWLLEEQG